MRHELTDFEWTAIGPFLPIKPRGAPRVAAIRLAFIKLAAALRRSKGLDVVLLLTDDSTVFAAWHGGERDSGRFTGRSAAWTSGRANQAVYP